MTERKAVRFLHVRGDGAPAIFLPDLGQRPIQALISGIMPSMVQRSPAASAIQPTVSPILAARTPLIELYRSGRRPGRDLVTGFLTSIYEVQVSSQADLDKLKREEGAKALGENFTPEEIEKLKMAENEALRKIEVERRKKNTERIQSQTDFAPIIDG
jgi:hypothetical protein